MRIRLFFISVVLVCQQLTGAYVKPVAAEPASVVVVAKEKPKPVVLSPKEIAKRASRSAGFDLTQWRCLDMLWTKESHFNPKARNKRSGAYGIAQFMPQTWKNYKVEKTSDPHLQVKYGLRYITKRYGSPCAAWKHHRQRGWY